jgi:hypothetical protein
MELELIATRECRIVPAWARSELIQTEAARVRLRQWVEAGNPEPSTRDVELRLRYQGSGETLALLRAELASGAIAPPAIWHLVARVLVVAFGRDARGLCFPAPMPDVERILIIRDDPLLTDIEVISVFKHELAHAWLLPVPPRDLSPEEEALVAGPEYWRAAASCGRLDAMRALAVADEDQAARLAAAWGGSGTSVDANLCANAVAAIAEREAAR